MMEHTQYLNLIESYPIDNYEGAAGNHQLPGSTNPPGAAEIGVEQ